MNIRRMGLLILVCAYVCGSAASSAYAATPRGWDKDEGYEYQASDYKPSYFMYAAAYSGVALGATGVLAACMSLAVNHTKKILQLKKELKTIDNNPECKAERIKNIKALSGKRRCFIALVVVAALVGALSGVTAVKLLKDFIKMRREARCAAYIQLLLDCRGY